MLILSNIVLFLALAAAIVFSLLVLLTGKGDAMSGGGSVRTSYKGKATFDDIMSRAALYLGVFFMGMVLVYSVLEKRLQVAGMLPSSKPGLSNPAPANNQPISMPPATNTPANPAANNAPATTASNNSPASTATNTPAASNAPANNAPAASNAPANNAPASNNAPSR